LKKNTKNFSKKKKEIKMEISKKYKNYLFCPYGSIWRICEKHLDPIDEYGVQPIKSISKSGDKIILLGLLFFDSYSYNNDMLYKFYNLSNGEFGFLCKKQHKKNIKRIK